MTLTTRQEREFAEIRELTRGLTRSTRELLDRIGEARGALAPPGPMLGFVHIPKTAGGTATTMLARAYSKSAVRDAGNYLRSPETTMRKASGPPGGWARWRDSGGRVAAGHVPYGVFRDRLPPDCRYMTFLREPVDRVLSHYYRHMYPDRQGGQEIIVGAGVASLDEVLSAEPPLELNNLATRFLCGSPAPIGELPASALDDARENLRRFAFVGIQERFEESIVLLQRTIGLDLVPYLDRHVSADGSRPTVEELPAEHRALIEDRNRLDLKLYAFGLELFEAAVAAAGEGLSADAEAIRASSADLNEEACQTARVWLDRDAPAGGREAGTLRPAAKDAGVPLAVLKKLVKQLPPTHRIFLRSGEVERGELSIKPLIAFVHVPRTAGATVRSVFEEAYTTGAVRNVGGSPSGDEESSAKLERQLRQCESWQRRGTRVVCGHVPYEVLTQHLPPNARYVTFLREPVDRVLSQYHSRPAAATTASLEETLEVPAPEFSNLATRFLAGEHPWGRDLPGSAIEEAKVHLREFALVGLREKFDESILLLWRMLGRDPVAQLDANVSIERPAIEEIPAEWRTLIEEHNQLDLELYAFAGELLDEAIAQAGDGFAAEAEGLRAARARANEGALERARALLEGRPPAGRRRRKRDISTIARDAGLETEAVKDLVERMAASSSERSRPRRRRAAAHRRR